MTQVKAGELVPEQKGAKVLLVPEGCEELKFLSFFSFASSSVQPADGETSSVTDDLNIHKLYATLYLLGLQILLHFHE